MEGRELLLLLPPPVPLVVSMEESGSTVVVEAVLVPVVEAISFSFLACCIMYTPIDGVGMIVLLCA